MEDRDHVGKGGAARDEAQILSLRALGWLLADASRADRLLALTGLDADALRAGLGDGAILSAVLAFLCDHEPDLLACADALGCAPQDIVNAREMLNR